MNIRKDTCGNLIMKPDKPSINVVQKDPAKPVPAQVIADSIVEIARAMKDLNNTRLKKRAIVTLIHDATGVTRRDIERVIGGLEQLEAEWLK